MRRIHSLPQFRFYGFRVTHYGFRGLRISLIVLWNEISIAAIRSVDPNYKLISRSNNKTVANIDTWYRTQTVTLRNLFLVFMWRHHFPKQRNINPCEVLVLSYARPHKNLPFATFEPDSVPHNVLNRVRLVRCVTLKCKSENALEKGKRWVVAQVLAN